MWSFSPLGSQVSVVAFALQFVVLSLLDDMYLFLSVELHWDAWAFTFQLLYLSSLLLVYHRLSSRVELIPADIHPAVHSPPPSVEWGQETEGKCEKNLWVKINSLISEGKNTRGNMSSCKQNHSLRPTRNLMPNYSHSKDCTGKTPSLSFIAEHDFLWFVICSWWVWVSSVPFQLLAHTLTHLLCRSEWEAGNILTLCKHFSAMDRTLLFYQHCFCHKSKIQWWKLTAFQPSPGHS